MGGSAIFFVVLIIGALLLLTLFLISWAANRSYVNYEATWRENTRRLADARRKQVWIKTHSEQEWPLWPRPLLFSQVDYSTQLALGRSFHANELLAEINGKIKPIHPLPSSLEAIFDVPGNLRRIFSNSYNKQQWLEFDKSCRIIDEAYQTVRKNHLAVEAIKNGIRQKVDNTASDFNASNLNIQFFQRLGSVRYEDAIRNINFAQECISHADLELASASQEDLVEWVAADLLCFAGLLSLSIFKLKGRSYTLPDTFEADLVLERLTDISDDLESVLDQQNLHHWKQLIFLKDQFLRLAEEIAKAAISLEEFEAQVQVYNMFINRLGNINLPEITSRTIGAEEALAEYFGPPTESPDWEKTLYRYKRPSAILEEKKSQLVRDITPSIQGKVIKQSALAQILRSLEEFLKGIERVEMLIRRIEGVAQYQHACERKVKQLVSKNGDIERLVQMIDTIVGDTAEDIRQDCQLRVNEFEELIQIAFGERKRTRFPILLSAVEEYKADCESLIARHEDSIKYLQDKASNYYRELGRLQTALTDYQYRLPVAEFNWIAISEEFKRVMRLYDGRDNSYTAISAFNEAAYRYMYESKAILRTLEQQHRGYSKKVDEVMREITTARRQVERSIMELERSWINPLSAYIDGLKQFEAEYIRLMAQVQPTENDLSEMTMPAALESCGMVGIRVAELKEQQQVLIDEAIYLMQELDLLKQHVDRLRLNRNLTENNMKAVSDAYLHIHTAQNTYDLNEAKLQLNAARLILEEANLPAPTVRIRINNFTNIDRS